MILFALLLLFSTSAEAITFEDEECLNYTVYPVQYDVTITPYVYTNTTGPYLDCVVTITVIANNPCVQIIELDAKDMHIHGVEVFDEQRNIINEHRPYEFNNKIGKIYIYLKEPLKQFSMFKKQYAVRIRITKKVSVNSMGIFLVPYEGGLKQLLVTRLSRKAKYFFPCFDDPRFDSVFRFRVYMVPESLGVQYANCSLVAADQQGVSSISNRFTLVSYLPSPQQTLDQIGFAYSQFGSIHVTSRNTHESIFLWAPPDKLHQYEYIMAFTERILNLIHEYSSVRRPLLKGPINIVAVPKNVYGYEVGSWKLLTNGESRLAYVPGLTSIKQREQMLFELTQQLSRIWLGNPGELERTKWREEWFKEGVATYLAYHWLTQYEHGAYTMKHRWPLGTYGLQMKHKGMIADWLHTTPTLLSFNRTLAVKIPSRYKELVIMKTASLLWMIENWLGSEKFHTALVQYINSRRGTDISLDNFLTILDLNTVECQNQFFNGSTASRILNSWFHQSGHPVINVNVLRDRQLDAIQLKQHRFSFTPDHRGDSHYLIPISYFIQNNENCFNCYQPRFTIDHSYTFEENLQGGWIILNRNASGYYRVNYDPVTWRLIAKTLSENHKFIDDMNRAQVVPFLPRKDLMMGSQGIEGNPENLQIVNDVFALYAAGLIDIDLALEILDYLDQETSSLVWYAAIAGFELLETENAACNMTKHLIKEWQEFMWRKVENIYKLFKDDIEQQPSTRVFRSNIIDFAYSVQYDPCVEDLKFRCSGHRGSERVDPDIRETCYYMLLRTNGNYGQLGFNAYEIEDKVNAEHKLARFNKFIYKTPNGEARPLPMRSTETPVVISQPSTTSDIHVKDASSSAVASLLTLTLATLIVAAIK